MSDLPPEVRVKPLALIGLTGLDISNSVHRFIWDAFNNSNRRADDATVQFKLLSTNHEFPTVKPKRNSYDWYIPKGILKRNWMNKYLNEIPAVVVIFYELEWNDSMWNEKKIECASRVQSLRAALEGRSTKIAVVLIQHGAQPPPGTEDIGTTERASALCAACELPAKSLYVLPHGDHLLGYTCRLENVFYEMAQCFYHQECRIVKSHREQLNKTSHQYLFIRHQFKMGFLNELKQDWYTAHKHYQQAYNLLDMRVVDTNLMEIKTVAGFINYKLCRLMFTVNCPKDAITQFKNHIERYKNRTGPQELMFEHHAWMASQYSTFAELFDEAIKQGLSAMQTQHPGYFFHSAAKETIRRRSTCQEFCKNVHTYPEPDPLAGEEKLEFYGQRPWRPGKLSAEPADMARETIAIQALQYREKLVNHSMLITSLLGNAISQFKIYRCPRMRRFLVVQMAEEYFNCKDYGKVLTLLMHMLWDYQGENWPVLLTDILQKALKAAYLSANIQDYLTLALESLAPSTTFSEDQKLFIYQNVNNILKRKPPNTEPNLPDHLTEGVVDKWNMELSRNEPLIFTIDDTNTTSFVEVKARFTEPKYTVHSTVTVEVFVRNLYHEKVEFSKITATINTMGSTSEYIVSDNTLNNFAFTGKETRKFVYQWEASRQNNIATDIQISTISLYLGNINSCCIILRFSSLGRDSSLLDRYYPEIQFRRSEFDKIKPLLCAQIDQEDCNIDMKVETQGPALIGEWFPIQVLLSSEEGISNIILRMSLFPDGNNDQSTELSLNMIEKQPNICIDINNINPNESVQRISYIRAHNVGDRNIIIKAEYNKFGQRRNLKGVVHCLPFVKPFDVTTQFYTMLYEPLTKGFIGEPLFIMPHITCTSPWPIKIIDTSVELGNSIEKVCESTEKSVLAELTLSEGEAATDVYCVVPKIGSEQPSSTGVFTIRWQRANEEKSIETSSSVTLTPLWVEDAVIGLEAKLPACGWVRTPLCATYFIKNHSEYLITLRLTIEGTDNFLCAGHKHIEICIQPESERKLEWVLFPLVAGNVALPSIILTIPPEDEYKLSKSRLEEVLERSLPSHIYIMPKSQTLEE